MRILLSAVIVLIYPEAFAAETNEQQLALYIQGTYILIGKKMNATNRYSSEVIITQSWSEMITLRNISGTVTQGIASIEQATSDHTPVLRIRFQENNLEFEETYVVANDLDNYARITCHLYRPGISTTKPGLEALFIKPRTF